MGTSDAALVSSANATQIRTILDTKDWSRLKFEFFSLWENSSHYEFQNGDQLLGYINGGLLSPHPDFGLSREFCITLDR